MARSTPAGVAACAAARPARPQTQALRHRVQVVAGRRSAATASLALQSICASAEMARSCCSTLSRQGARREGRRAVARKVAREGLAVVRHDADPCRTRALRDRALPGSSAECRARRDKARHTMALEEETSSSEQESRPPTVASAARTCYHEHQLASAKSCSRRTLLGRDPQRQRQRQRGAGLPRPQRCAASSSRRRRSVSLR